MKKDRCLQFGAYIATACVWVCGLVPSAQAQSDSKVAVEGYIGAVTDYRDRGLSLSGFDPAITASVGAFHDSGAYFGIDGAAFFDSAVGLDGRARLFAGYSLDRGDYVYDFSVELDSVHGTDSNFFPELRATVSRDFGLAFTRSGISIAPDGRWSNPTGESYYVFADVEVPVPTFPALTVITHVGHDVRSGGQNLWNWSAGLSAFVGDIELAGRYEKSSINNRIGNGRFLFSLRYFF